LSNSLCILCVLCVSVVNVACSNLTTETRENTEGAQRKLIVSNSLLERDAENRHARAAQNFFGG
jgi:hypothetical protein